MATFHGGKTITHIGRSATDMKIIIRPYSQQHENIYDEQYNSTETRIKIYPGIILIE